MPSKEQIVALYRLYFTLTRRCPDRSLKLYIRRKAHEDFHSLIQHPPSEAHLEFDRLKADLEVVRRQMAIRTLYVAWK
jgi:hypothetical protein